MISRRNILKIIGLILIYISVSLGVYFILKACGLNSISKIRKLVDKTGGWGYVLFFMFQVATSTFICIVPFEDEFLTGCALIFFGPVKGFIVEALCMFATSCLQFCIGRYFCKDVVKKIMGENCLGKYENYLKIKGEVMLPFLYCIPLFPHDTLCLLAGMSKMRFWYFALVTGVLRSVEIASVCFLGSGIIDYTTFSIIDWIMVINLLIIDVYLLIKLQNYIEKKVNSKEN